MKSLIVLALLCGTAAADTHKIGEDEPAVLKVSGDWEKAKTPDAPDGPALVMKTDDGGLLAVTVAKTSNTSAYRRKLKQAFLDDVVAGFTAMEGVTVTDSKIGKQGKVPSVDVWMKRGKQEIAVRVLLFRSKTIGVAVSGGDKASRAAVIKGLVPN